MPSAGAMLLMRSRGGLNVLFERFQSLAYLQAMAIAPKAEFVTDPQPLTLAN
ncbi:hypothetical protein [Coleofasciculus sp. FACHB-1120]|uniref:hypothetical protein n=1 Tax=Coleofasciculus sp. FACHB-1120 TaxID=2692783 RepID=UPI0016882A32|nr:hypothetical protein [Coleofasciculus sp. FACHB-1120]MBD2744013.1 hypothetical protein [Coleofasciculus sp. FACHB-1120]